jgi:hypothetical protein
MQSKKYIIREIKLDGIILNEWILKWYSSPIMSQYGEGDVYRFDIGYVNYPYILLCNYTKE